MIYPVNCNFEYLRLEGYALAFRGNMLLELRGAQVSIEPLNTFELARKTLLDGAVLRYELGAGKYRGDAVKNCLVNYCEASRRFEGVYINGISDGYLYGSCISDGRVSFVYQYKAGRYFEFPKESVVLLVVEGFIVLVKSRQLRTVDIVNLNGEIVDGFEHQVKGFLSSAEKAFRVGDKIYINCFGNEGPGLLQCFSLSERKLLPPISLDSYMGALCSVGDAYFYIDGESLRCFNPESPRDSKTIARLPSLTCPKMDSGRGDEWLWWDGVCLYVASLRGRRIWSYDLDGNLLHEHQVPEGWRILRVDKENVEAGQNIVRLMPTAHEWGFDAVLSWLPGDFCNEDLMQIESIESVEVEQIPGKKDKHGFRMIARDANGEHLARHAMHHFARLANKVAPSTMNGGRVNDKDFDGVLELILVIPQRQALEQAYIDYVIEGCEQMRYPLQSHRAANKRDPIKLKLCWQASAGGDMELLYDSEASSE